MGVKRIEDMIRTRQLGDVKRIEMIAFLRELGFEPVDGGRHQKFKRKEKGLFKTDWVPIPRHNVLRKDEVRYILKEIGLI